MFVFSFHQQLFDEVELLVVFQFVLSKYPKLLSNRINSNELEEVEVFVDVQFHFELIFLVDLLILTNLSFFNETIFFLLFLLVVTTKVRQRITSWIGVQWPLN
jgi:hypothetical protein